MTSRWGALGILKFGIFELEHRYPYILKKKKNVYRNAQKSLNNKNIIIKKYFVPYPVTNMYILKFKNFLKKKCIRMYMHDCNINVFKIVFNGDIIFHYTFF